MNRSDIEIREKSPGEITEKMLISLREGDHAAFGELYMSFADPLVRFIDSLIKDTEAARELTQDIFSYVWENRADIRVDLRFKNFLYTLAKNRALNFIRHKKTQEKYSSYRTHDQQNVLHSSTDETVIFNETNQTILHVIDAMPAQRKKAFILSRYEGLSYDEIARQLDISPATVKKHVELALRDIRSALYGKVVKTE